MKKGILIAAAVMVLVVVSLVIIPVMLNRQGFYEIHVGGDYSVMHVSPELQTISRRMSDRRSFERLAAGQITGLACVKHLAVGLLNTQVLSTDDFRDLRTEKSISGYFVLDSRSGRLDAGKDEAGYRALLSEYDADPPELKPLSPMRRLGCNFVLP